MKYLHSSMERLKAVPLTLQTGHSSIFTFQYGEIKSSTESSVVSLSTEFTFQYGEIKRVTVNKTAICNDDLHSSMERLKGRYCYERRSMGRIYIPVWRD